MPLQKIIYFPDDIWLAFWEISENIEQLWNLLPVSEAATHTLKQEIASFHPKRQREIIAAHGLLYYILNKKFYRIQHNEQQKPLIKELNDMYISVSHTDSCVVVALAKNRVVGVDAEQISEQAWRVRERFMNEAELQWAGNDIKKCTLLWSIKESAYKWQQQQGLNFKKDIQIQFHSARTLEEYYTVYLEKDDLYLTVKYAFDNSERLYVLCYK